MERKRLIPNNDSIDADSCQGLHLEKPENNVSEHELDSALLAEEETAAPSFSWPLRKVVVLASLCLVTGFSFGALSMIAAFYPHEAEAKGVSNTVVGLVFGIYPLVIFIFAPVCGLVMARYGSNIVLFIGMLSNGASSILFGFCAWIFSTTEFVVLSFLLRALSASGAAACETAVMSIVIEKFPDRIGMASGLIQTFAGVAVSIGPVTGGGLYTVGGFQLPFFVIGFSMIAAIPVAFAALSSECRFQSGLSTGQEDASFPMMKALKIPAVLMIAQLSSFHQRYLLRVKIVSIIVCCFVTTGMMFVFIQPILGPHLEKDVLKLAGSQSLAVYRQQDQPQEKVKATEIVMNMDT